MDIGKHGFFMKVRAMIMRIDTLCNVASLANHRYGHVIANPFFAHGNWHRWEIS